MGDHVLFFYGTLMAPPVLHRVIHGHPTPEKWQRDLLTIKPAILHSYRRHRVRHADYPGIVSVSTDPNTDANTGPESSVLGTVVSGLTDGDVYRLDMFEGSEYEKREVVVRVLGKRGEGEGEEGVRGVLDKMEDGANAVGEGVEVRAVTYVWTAGEERLEDAEWDFEAFKRDKMAWWVEADKKDW
ncbi:disease resistance protein Aig2 [Aspergillus ellipticus CBS 707.79]|uniref:Putative gamma-glutamylcyclotransferase n=1 Tax=Aspergillus ellipticus CBS 707.79 TaxID=1448320 RepID=A0A319E5Z8_9EURO|nr:disease resistance protein Aig2 [Aspergillus ellipticus CBS 707.79]